MPSATVFAVVLAVAGAVAAQFGVNGRVGARRRIALGASRRVIGPDLAFALMGGVLGLLAIPIVVAMR